MSTLDRFGEAFRERAEGTYLGTVQEVVKYIRGWSSINVLAALGAAVDVSGAGYLEVGCMNGLSLCGATVGNGDRLFVGVDNFSQPAARRDPLGTVGKIHPGVEVRFYEMDYREFFRAHAGQYRGQIGCYFYDADHAYEHQKLGLELGAKSGVLTPEAFVAVDDYSWPSTKRAVREFLAAHPEWEIILEEEDDWNRRGWWNGLVMLYRNGGRGGERPEGDS